MTPEYCY